MYPRKKANYSPESNIKNKSRIQIIMKSLCFTTVAKKTGHEPVLYLLIVFSGQISPAFHNLQIFLYTLHRSFILI